LIFFPKSYLSRYHDVDILRILEIERILLECILLGEFLSTLNLKMEKKYEKVEESDDRENIIRII
jgi:hypothetical protein